MSDVTQLASGTINGADELVIELVQPDNHPAAVRIVWPAKTSIIPPTRFPAAAAEAVRLFAAASTKLSRLKAHGR